MAEAPGESTMFPFDYCFVRFGLFYLIWPVIVMLAFVLWSSIKSDSLLGLLRGLGATIMVGAMVLLGWFIGSFIVIVLPIALLVAVGVSIDALRIILLIMMALAMIIGSVLGWRYLDQEMGSDARNWRL